MPILKRNSTQQGWMSSYYGGLLVSQCTHWGICNRKWFGRLKVYANIAWNVSLVFHSWWMKLLFEWKWDWQTRSKTNLMNNKIEASLLQGKLFLVFVLGLSYSEYLKKVVPVSCLIGTVDNDASWNDCLFPEHKEHWFTFHKYDCSQTRQCMFQMPPS